MRVLELFSGIGGMRHGLERGVDDQRDDMIFTSIDLNQFCNEIYRESFGEAPVAADITGLTLEWFEHLGADIWTMAPPCQPYSRQGGLLQSKDPRARPLHYLINILRSLKRLPNLIILENVKNFETSDSCSELVGVLKHRGYRRIRGFLINPLYMGFPNSRLRFFLVAQLGMLEEPESTNSFPIVTNDPQCASEYPLRNCPSWMLSNMKTPIDQFLCSGHSPEVLSQLMVPASLLSKQAAFCFDIVSPASVQSLCFTRAYTKFVNGTGSVLYDDEWSGPVDDQKRPIFGELSSMVELNGKLRYFCPMEIARLNGFPVDACHGHCHLLLPTACHADKQTYRALGNSLNPHIVAQLFKNVLS